MRESFYMYFYISERNNIMNKNFKVLTISAAVLALSISANNYAAAKDAAGFCVAVVDVQKIVENSPQISALKAEQKNKINGLATFVEKAKADVAKQADDAKKKALEESYNKELNTKKAAIDKDAATKLVEFDKSVRDIIKAKAANFDLVLTKSSVIDGGTDITDEVIKELK